MMAATISVQSRLHTTQLDTRFNMIRLVMVTKMADVMVLMTLMMMAKVETCSHAWTI